MRLGRIIDTTKPVPEVVEQVQRLADAGFASAVASQIFGADALTLLAVVGAQVPGIELVTSVVPTWPRHPVMLAGQALTVQSAIGDRLTLGIGLSHQVVVESVFGTPFARPARHMQDYLAILQPLLRGEQVSYAGETLSSTTFAPLDIPAPPPRVLVAALAPRMLALAGREADGTATWMTGPATLESHIVPSITKAATEVGRPTPRVAVGLPIAVTSDVGAAREAAARQYALYGTLPSYQSMLSMEGATSPGDVAVVGDEASVTEQLRHLAGIGVTDFYAAPLGSADDVRATVALLSALNAEAGSW